MRFLLDNDVDAAVGRVLRGEGHECWTCSEAGLAGRVAAVDDEVSIYAHDKGAVVVTHDREFSRRRIRRTFGKHLWLRCEQPDAASLVSANAGAVEAALVQHVELVVVLSAGGIEVHAPAWD